MYRPFHTKSEMIKTEENVNSKSSNKPFSFAAILDCMKNKTQEKKVSLPSQLQKTNKHQCYVYLHSKKNL